MLAQDAKHRIEYSMMMTVVKFMMMMTGDFD
jgi:hypothetical protein